MKHSTKRRVLDNSGNTYTKMLKAVAIGLLVTAVLLLLLSFVLSKRDFSFMLINPLATLALGVGSMLSGFLSARSFRERGMLMGGLSGLIIFAIVLIVSAMFQFELGAKAIIKLAVTVLGGCVGGIIGINKRNKRRV